MIGEQTTFHRPIVNARDEPLCADRTDWVRDDPKLARLHVIFFDATLCQVATLLRVGTLQIVAALIEAGAVLPSLALDDPLDALQRWGHDPSLSATASLVGGRMTTPVELQQRFLDEARRHAAVHGFDGVVPRAGEILDLWEDTIVKLRARDFASLTRRLDWVLKRQILERAMAARPGLTWSSPEIRYLDQMYASVDPGEGLFWACEEAGLVDTVVDGGSVQRAMHEPPEDTRAWTRAQLLRRAGAARTVCVDWDRVTLRRTRHSRGWGDLQQIVWLPQPFAATKSEHGNLFSPEVPFDAVLDALGSSDSEAVASVRSSHRMS
jgi:proteasome accessory factor A